MCHRIGPVIVTILRWSAARILIDGRPTQGVEEVRSCVTGDFLPEFVLTSLTQKAFGVAY
jgi:hypothetical protein